MSSKPTHGGAAKQLISDNLADARQSRRLRWLLRILPLAFLLLLVALASHQIQSLDIHAIRLALQQLSLTQLLLIQLIAFVGVLAMSLYDWRTATVFTITRGCAALRRNFIHNGAAPISRIRRCPLCQCC